MHKNELQDNLQTSQSPAGHQVVWVTRRRNLPGLAQGRLECLLCHW